ncbi:MAG: glycosyltransferase family 9 protein, partial [Bryobacteraceae bacterium]
SLGDCVLTTPALSILKNSRPDICIAVVVEDRFAPVFTGNPAVDAILSPSIPALRSWRPQLCLNLHGGTRSAVLTAASGARFRAGFAHFRYPAIYNVRIPRAQQILGVDRVVHTAEHLASAMFFLGTGRQEIPRASLFAAGSGQPGPYAVIHPFASHPDKTWPAASFLAVAQHLAKDAGLEPVFIAGPRDDLSPFAAFRSVVAAPLDQIKQLLAGASLFAGNDSGPAHMAAAFGLPVVVIFSSSDASVWHPWRTASEVLHSPAVPEVIEALARLKVHV